MEPMRPEFSSTTMMRRVPVSCCSPTNWSKGSIAEELFARLPALDGARAIARSPAHGCPRHRADEEDIEFADPAIALLREADVGRRDPEGDCSTPLDAAAGMRADSNFGCVEGLPDRLLKSILQGGGSLA